MARTVEDTSTHKPMFVVALAASAGGLAAISQILSTLPAEFPAAIVVLQHVSPNHISYLSDILSRRTRLKVKQAEPNDQLLPGVIYIAPPNWHLLVKPGGVLTLSQTAPLHFVRPSADVLFESLATSFKNYAIVVILTGTGYDGSEAIKTVKDMGGTVIAQDKTTSEFFGMPEAAIRTGYVDHVLPLNEISPLLLSLVSLGNVE